MSRALDKLYTREDDEDEPTSQPSDSDSAKTQVAPMGLLPNLLDPTIEMEGIRPIGSEDGYDHMKPVALTSDTDTPTTTQCKKKNSDTKLQKRLIHR